MLCLVQSWAVSNRSTVLGELGELSLCFFVCLQIFNRNNFSQVCAPSLGLTWLKLQVCSKAGVTVTVKCPIFVLLKESQMSSSQKQPPWQGWSSPEQWLGVSPVGCRGPPSSAEPDLGQALIPLKNFSCLNCVSDPRDHFTSQHPQVLCPKTNYSWWKSLLISNLKMQLKHVASAIPMEGTSFLPPLAVLTLNLWSLHLV